MLSERLDVSASKKKIEKSEGSFKDYEDNFSVDTQSRLVIENEHNKNIAIALEWDLAEKRTHFEEWRCNGNFLDNGKAIGILSAFQNIVLNEKVRTTCDN
ncbi:hypothetical protein TNCV_822791 [Trichonephila clavipes]|nr:hypothetical protein TNCV_822791 [Trichonephila clavipes]